MGKRSYKIIVYSRAERGLKKIIDCIGLGRLKSMLKFYLSNNDSYDKIDGTNRLKEFNFQDNRFGVIYRISDKEKEIRVVNSQEIVN